MPNGWAFSDVSGENVGPGWTEFVSAGFEQGRKTVLFQ
jgi:hypothetical protein